MTLVWDTKNNFILLHSIIRHQEQLSTLDINWLMILNDIQSEIYSTAIELKIQYENLVGNFHLKKDLQSLYSTLKENYLHSLCEKIEDNSELTLIAVYELLRHVRAERITADDIEQLLKESNFNYSSNDQKINKAFLFKILNRFYINIRKLPWNNYQPIHHYRFESSTLTKEINDEELESISDNEITMIKTDNNRVIPNREKSSFTRRRTQSLTIFTENKDNKVNIGVEWFVPKFKRQQRSLSLHARCQSPVPIESSSLQDQNLPPSGILITTIDNDESSDSMSNSDLRQTQSEPMISWLPLTSEQIDKKEIKFLDGQQLDQVSSDSDSTGVQWLPTSNNETSCHRATSSSSHDLHQQEHMPSKRQRLS